MKGALLLISVVRFCFPSVKDHVVGGSGKKCLYSGRYRGGDSSFCNFPHHHPFCTLPSPISDCRGDRLLLPPAWHICSLLCHRVRVCCIKHSRCSGGEGSSRAVFTCSGAELWLRCAPFLPDALALDEAWELSGLCVNVMRKEIWSCLPAPQLGWMGKSCR